MRFIDAWRCGGSGDDPGARSHLRQGRVDGFPLCCIAQFVIDCKLRRSPAIARGGDGKGYVPCSLHRIGHREQYDAGHAEFVAAILAARADL